MKITDWTTRKVAVKVRNEVECFHRMMILIEHRPGIWTSEMRRAIPEVSNEVFREATGRIQRSPLVRVERDGVRNRYYLRNPKRPLGVIATASIPPPSGRWYVETKCPRVGWFPKAGPFGTEAAAVDHVDAVWDDITERGERNVRVRLHESESA